MVIIIGIVPRSLGLRLPFSARTGRRTSFGAVYAQWRLWLFSWLLVLGLTHVMVVDVYVRVLVMGWVSFWASLALWVALGVTYCCWYFCFDNVGGLVGRLG